MKRYIVTFYGGNMALRYGSLSKADQETQDTHKTAWKTWMANLASAGRLETGYPLESQGKRISARGVEDYSFPDTTEGGFILMKAETPEEAAEIAQSSPIIKNGGYVLVRPCGTIE